MNYIENAVNAYMQSLLEAVRKRSEELFEQQVIYGSGAHAFAIIDEAVAIDSEIWGQLEQFSENPMTKSPT